MSCYYCFYLLKKTDKVTEEGLTVYDYAGSFQSQEGRGKAVPLEVRSRSFIHGDTFEAWNRMEPSQFSKEALDALFSQDMLSEGDWSGMTLRICPFTEEIFEARDVLLTRGYVTVDEFDTIVESNYDSEYLEWEAEIKKPEFIAALPPKRREAYVPIAFLNRHSDAYIYETIRQAADMLNVYPFDTRGEYYILCIIG